MYEYVLLLYITDYSESSGVLLVPQHNSRTLVKNMWSSGSACILASATKLKNVSLFKPREEAA